MFVIGPVTPRPASEPGALAHFAFECTCGTKLGHTFKLSAEKLACEHYKWHAKRGEEVTA